MIKLSIVDNYLKFNELRSRTSVCREFQKWFKKQFGESADFELVYNSINSPVVTVPQSADGTSATVAQVQRAINDFGSGQTIMGEEAPESVPFTLGRTTGEYRASGTLTVEEGFWSELERSQRALIRETMMAADRRVAEALQAAASPVDADLDTHAELFYGSPRRPAETDQQLRQRLSDMWQTMTPPTGDTVDFVVGPSCSLTAEQLAQVRCIVGAEPSPPFTIDGVEVDPEVADHDLPLLLPLIGRSVGVEELTRLTRQLTWNGSLVQERRLVRRQDEDGVVVAWTRERRRGDVVVV